MLDNQYFKKYLADRDVDLSKHLDIEKHCKLEFDPEDFTTFAEKYRDEAVVKSWHPRPFLGAMGNEQAINANWIGYNKHNTTESNWGLDPAHNKELIDSYLQKIRELTEEYKSLTLELNTNGVNDQTIDALISNLQLRLQLMKRLKKQLNTLKEVNSKRNENIS